jgi:hypothetical protein
MAEFLMILSGAEGSKDIPEILCIPSGLALSGAEGSKDIPEVF